MTYTEPYALRLRVMHQGAPVEIIGRCYVNGWLYQLKDRNGAITDYVPHGALRGCE